VTGPWLLVLTGTVHDVTVVPPTRPDRNTMNNKSDVIGVALCWLGIVLAALYLLAQIIRVIV